MAATDRLNELKSDLKKVQDELKDNTKVVGSAWSTAAKYAVGVSVVVGIAGAVADVYYGTGYMKAAKEAGIKHGTRLMEKGREVTGRARTQGSMMYEGAKKRLGYGNATAPVATTPSYNLPEYR